MEHGGGGPGAGEASILLVDDRRSNLLALEALLEPLGRRTVLAESGAEALRHLLNEEFAVILLDVQMPGMDGFETARLIRARPRTRQVPIIFVTAISTASEHAFEGYRAGAVDYILKPIDPVVLQSKVSVFLELWEMHRQLVREAEAHAVQESLALAQRAGEGGIWDWDLRPGGRVYWSPEYAALIGLGDGEHGDGAALFATADPRDRARIMDRLDEFLRNGGAWDEEFRVVHPHRGVRWIATRGRLLRDGTGAAQRFTGIAVDVTDRRHEMDRLARLQKATAVLSAALTPAAVAVAILSDGASAAGAEGAWLLMLDKQGQPAEPTGTSGTLTSGDAEALWEHGRRVLHDGAPLQLHRLGERWVEGPSRDSRSAVLLPLLAGATRGVLGLVFGPPGPGDEEVGGFLSALAAPCAEALERARLYEAEHRARERAEALGTAISLLAGGSVASEVADLIAREAVRTLGATSAGVLVPIGRTSALRPAAGAGYPDELVRPHEPVPMVKGSPAADCVLTRAPAVGADPADGTAVVALPMIAGGRLLGALVLRVARGRAADQAEVDAMAAYARLAAQALARAELHEAGQRDRERAIFMAEVALTLSLALEEQERLERLGALLVPRRADAFLAVVGADRPEAEISVQAADEAKAQAALAVVSTSAAGMRALGDLRAPVLVGDVTEKRREGDPEEAWRAVLAEAGVRSAVLVPVSVRGRPAGALAILSLDPARSYDEDDRALAVELGHRVGLAIDNARLYEAQRDVAATLQRSLLPDRLPRLARVALASRYVSAAAETQAGGDWYEAVELGPDRIVLGVGDVVGRGTEAAAVMGQLRSAMRAYALAGLSPAGILSELSRFAQGVAGAEVATTACVAIDVAAERIAYATAGHPPPLVVFPNGRTAFLTGSHGPALGLGRSEYAEGELAISPGSTVVLYTDGLVERRREPLDRSLQRMARLASPLGTEDPGALCDALLHGLIEPSGADDVALLVASLRAVVAPLETRLGGGDGRLADARKEIRRWLSDLAMDAGRAEDLVLAASEALTNAVEHAYDGGGTGPVELRLQQRPDGAVTATIRDHGRWRPAMPAPDRGRGIEIMRRVMDEVEVMPSDRGTTVRMVVGVTPSEVAVPRARPRAAAADARLSVQTEHGGAGVAVLRLSGELDGAALPALASASAGRTWPATVVVEMTDVGFVDSAGSRALLELVGRIESAGASVRVVAPSGSPARRVIELAGIEQVVAVVEDVPSDMRVEAR